MFVLAAAALALGALALAGIILVVTRGDRIAEWWNREPNRLDAMDRGLQARPWDRW